MLPTTAVQQVVPKHLWPDTISSENTCHLTGTTVRRERNDWTDESSDNGRKLAKKTLSHTLTMFTLSVVASTTPIP